MNTNTLSLNWNAYTSVGTRIYEEHVTRLSRRPAFIVVRAAGGDHADVLTDDVETARAIIADMEHAANA